jgi:penicillin-binding protein 1A
MGLKVYTTADVDLHRDGQEAINAGIDGLVQRNGYRGPLRHLAGKELAVYQARQIKYYNKYPPRKGLSVTALVASYDKKRQVLNLHLGDQWAVLAENSKGPQGVSPGELRPGDVVQVRLLSRDRRSKIWTAELIRAPMVQAAVFSMELKTGKVRVLIGGKDFGDSTFNRATQARRQPGSAFKPVIYAAAIEKGFRPDSILQDEPISLPGGKRGQEWTPQNYDHKFNGPMTLASCLAHSRNVPTVRLMMAIGVPATLRMAQTLGITSPIFPNYASALGASDVTLFELTRAYSVFPNRGALVEPAFINRIEDRDGRVLVNYQVQSRRVLDAEAAQTMTRLMLGVVERGTATRVQVLGRPIAGKTGTTNNFRDAWFIGFTPSLITGAWMGMDDDHSLGPKETGSQAAAPVFIKYMKVALSGQPVEEFPEIHAILAKKGDEQTGKDEEATEGDDTFYPEEEVIKEKAPSQPSATSQQFFKNDLDEE